MDELSVCYIRIPYKVNREYLNRYVHRQADLSSKRERRISFMDRRYSKLLEVFE